MFGMKRERSIKMRQFLTLISLAILVTLTLFAMGAKDKSSKSIQVELKSLKSEIAYLEKRVKQLEEQFQQVSKGIKNYSVTIPRHFPGCLRCLKDG